MNCGSISCKTTRGWVSRPYSAAIGAILGWGIVVEEALPVDQSSRRDLAGARVDAFQRRDLLE